MRRSYLLPFVVAGMLLSLTGCSAGGPTKLEVERQNGINHMNDGNYEDALKSFENAYALCDDRMPQTKTDIALHEAACEFSLGNYEDVIKVCDKILELGENGDTYYMRGVANLHLENEEAAKADFDLASEWNNKDYQMFLNIYHQYEAISQSAIGDQYIQKALAIPNDTMEDYYQKGYIYYYLGEYSEALDALAIPVENKEEDAMLLMGESYLSLGDSVRARSIFQQYLDEYEDSARAYNGLALCDLTDKAYDTALTDIASGLSAEPDEDTRRELLYNEIVAYEMKLDFDTAKAKSEAFAEKYPDDADGKRENAFLSTR